MIINLIDVLAKRPAGIITLHIEVLRLIDLHSHILAQVDDGSQSIDESITLAKMYVDAGFTHVAATPHCFPGTSQVPEVQFISDKIVALNMALEEKGIPLTVLQGMEIGIDPELMTLIQQHRILSLGGSTALLIETPFQRLPRGWEQFMMKLKEAGYTVLMGHPERSAQLMKNPAICRQFVDLGLYIQITWDSFLGNNGPGVKRLTDYMIANGYVHVMATDTHRINARNPGNVKEGIENMVKQIGSENTTLLCFENPQSILQNISPKPIEMTGVSKLVNQTFRWPKMLKKLF